MTSAASATQGLRNWLLLSALGLIWGSSFIGVEIAIRGLGPLSVAAARIALAAAILTPLAMTLGDGLPPMREATGRKVWLHALGVAAAANAIPFSLLAWAQIHISAGLAAIFMASLPLVVLPLSHVFVPGERMTLRRSIGFAIGFSGVVVLIGPAALGDLGGGGLVGVLAQLAAIGAVIGYATGSITTKLAPKTHPLSFAAAAMLLAAAMTVPAALIWERPLAATPGVGAIVAIVLLAVFATALAMILLLKILETAGPPFLSLVNYMVPVWAVLFGALFLGEAVEPRFALALGLILVGVAIGQNLVGLRRFGRAGHG